LRDGGTPKRRGARGDLPPTPPSLDGPDSDERVGLIAVRCGQSWKETEVKKKT